MKAELIDKIAQILGKERVLLEEPMSRHTTFRIGGPAEIYVEPLISELEALLQLCQQEVIPYTIIGNGSNLLVADSGIRGLVIALGKQAGNITVEDDMITAEAGALLSRVASTAAEYSLGGMEFAAGIPGTIGGAVVMNAGAYGGEMKDILVDVTVLSKQGEIVVIPLEELQLSYRHSVVMEQEDIVLSARLQLQSAIKDDIISRMNELKEQRITKQPLNYPSAGSTFKRPTGYFAGKLIMDAGLRGYQVGGAQVSEKHCGFVVNTGGATAADVRQVIQDVSDVVLKKYGVTLEPEVKMIGEF